MPERCPPAQELASKLSSVDRAMTDAHARLSRMVKNGNYTEYVKVKRVIDAHLEWLASSTGVARAMVARLQPKSRRPKAASEAASGP